MRSQNKRKSVLCVRVCVWGREWESRNIVKIYQINQDYRKIYFFISGTIFLSFMRDVTLQINAGLTENDPYNYRRNNSESMIFMLIMHLFYVYCCYVIVIFLINDYMKNWLFLIILWRISWYKDTNLFKAGNKSEIKGDHPTEITSWSQWKIILSEAIFHPHLKIKYHF